MTEILMSGRALRVVQTLEEVEERMLDAHRANDPVVEFEVPSSPAGASAPQPPRQARLFTAHIQGVLE